MLDKVPEGAGDVMNQLHIWKKAPLVTSRWASESVELVGEKHPVPSSEPLSTKAAPH